MASFPLHITKPYTHIFSVDKSGLVAIEVSARCKAAQQLRSNTDEDLRVVINGLQCREVFPEKYTQLFNVPSAFNGTKLKGLRKSVVFLTVLGKGQHVVSLIPRPSATVEAISIHELQVSRNTVSLDIETKAEDGDRRPWYTFVPVDLPVNEIIVDATVSRRLWDSDDVKIIVNNDVKKSIAGGRHKYWHLVGGLLGWIIVGYKGQSSRTSVNLSANLDAGIHYLELYADRQPVLHKVTFSFQFIETDAEKRAVQVIIQNAPLIKLVAREFEIDPAIIAAVIYQEQATNVNFIDYLADYIVGLVGVNTSIGVAQIRIDTAAALEKHYSDLNPLDAASAAGTRAVRIERLKDPLTNIRYAAAKIRFALDQWEKEGFSINNKPEIVGTLYNIDDINKPIVPHGNPTPNDFGKGVARNYSKVQTILAL